MIIKIPLTASMRTFLPFVETLSIDLAGNDEINELAASAAEARLHIDILHAVVKSGDLSTAAMIIADWETGQC
jgi:hypothetical protein